MKVHQKHKGQHKNRAEPGKPNFNFIELGKIQKEMFKKANNECKITKIIKNNNSNIEKEIIKLLIIIEIKIIIIELIIGNNN